MYNPEITGTEYQEGLLFDYDNVRAYVIARDEYKCMNPDCTNKSHILEVHHIKFRSDSGTDKPSNLITLCKECHSQQNHQVGGMLHISTRKMNKWLEKHYDFRDKSNIGRVSSVSCYLVDELSKNKDINQTFGYITDRTRKFIGIDKYINGVNSHSNDAFCIALPIRNHIHYVDNNGRKIAVINDNVVFTKNRNAIRLKQIGRRGNNSRRSLTSFYDAEYIDRRNGLIRSGKELSKIMSSQYKKVVEINNRIFRLRKPCIFDKIIEFKIGKDKIKVCILNKEQEFKINDKLVKIINNEVYVDGIKIESIKNFDKLIKNKKSNQTKLRKGLDVLGQGYHTKARYKSRFQAGTIINIDKNLTGICVGMSNNRVGIKLNNKNVFFSCNNHSISNIRYQNGFI